MSASLQDFMAERAELIETVKAAVSKRYKDSEGQAIEWEIRVLTGDEDRGLRKKHLHTVPIAGKRGQYQQEFDADEYIAEMAARCTVFPKLSDKALQDSYGVMGEVELLRTMLLAGEYQGYLDIVQQVNGFMTPEEELEQAKK